MEETPVTEHIPKRGECPDCGGQPYYCDDYQNCWRSTDKVESWACLNCPFSESLYELV